MSSSFTENRDEFEWEKELRKDDERVRSYMEELPKYIDLPDEDGVIMKKIQRRPELVPQNGVWPSMSGRDDDFEDSGDEDLSPEEWAKRDGADVCSLASCVARDFCIFNAFIENQEDNRVFMQILCSLGKIMARSADIVDMERGELPKLRIALGKRLLSDVNYIMGRILELEQRFPEQKDNLEYLTEQMQIMRERILNLMDRARHPEKDPPPEESEERE